jgi:GABA(A) receptor-associated protein
MQKEQMSPFKKANSIDKRLKESSRVLDKFPDRIPVICEPGKNTHKLPKIDKTKFLVPKDITIAHFVMIIRGRLKLDASVALFFVVGDVIASSNSTMNELYANHADADGFLYMTYSEENTFGFGFRDKYVKSKTAIEKM